MSSTTHDLIPTVIGTICTAIAWGLIWWHVISKMGYKRRFRQILLALMFIPGVNAGCLMFLLLFPWPVRREIRELKKQLAELQQRLPGHTRQIDEELKRLREKRS